MGTIAVIIAARTLSSLHYPPATLFQRHAALLVTNNAVCRMSGFDFEVQVIRFEIIHRNIVVFSKNMFSLKSLLLVHTVNTLLFS